MVVIFVRIGWGGGRCLGCFLYLQRPYLLALCIFSQEESVWGGRFSAQSGQDGFPGDVPLFLPVFLMSLASVTLLNVDVILVKNLFNPILMRVFTPLHRWWAKS